MKLRKMVRTDLPAEVLRHEEYFPIRPVGVDSGLPMSL